jgi:peptide deformylase
MNTIRLYGDPVLRMKSQEVTAEEMLRRDVNLWVSTMVKVMHENKGIGLAAPQIGLLKRIIVADVGSREGLIVLINPQILSSDGKEVMEEGCLSLPGVYLEVKRAARILVKGMNEKGLEAELELAGLLARVVQHEVDHLDGILIIDRVPHKRLKPIKNKLEEIKQICTKSRTL